MGNSLHNKIYLGRRVRSNNARSVAALVLLVLGGVFWLLASG
ncbi:hypothetical protein AAKU55_001508 [Oxalobacteraceae bacterium GrIS 1.11]